MMATNELAALQQQLAGATPRSILKAALDRFERIAVSFSGAEDVALIDMACQIRPGLDVFTLDTGRLHADTYRFIETVRKHYPIRLQVYTPDSAAVEALVRDKGLFSFYEDGHKECCAIRKVAPLRRALSQYDAWLTGQRRDQSADTRAQLAEVELDSAFSTPDHPLIKFNPLAGWTSAQVWAYIDAYETPYNPLHAQGYVSIGCEPCTRAILPNQPERAGRWWWEDNVKKECGLHSGNLGPSTP